MSTARARLLRRARRYLSIWKENIGLDNELGLTDINSDAEDFCCGLLNIVLDANFQNLNLLQMNFPAIDLADNNKRLCIQVTSTAGAEKIRHTLERFFDHGLDANYDRLIVMILGKKKKYQIDFPQKEGFAFDPMRDVWDIKTLLNQMTGLTMPALERMDDYLREQFDDLKELAPPMDLPVLSALDDRTFLGRSAELDEIVRRFDDDEKIVLLSGVGGMGKSELAARFAQTQWGGESYFVRFTKSWKQTVLENVAPHIRGMNREGSDADQIYRDAVAELKSRGRDELLILDNVDDENISLTQLKRELSSLNLRILITTRKNAAHAIPVAKLHKDELLDLFDLHESAATVEERNALIEAVGGHTLTVDLIARALRPGRKAATAEKLLTNLADPSVRKVETAYFGAPSQAQIMEHLKVVFRVSELGTNEQELLRYATLLPDGGMEDDLFLLPLGTEMEDHLDSLVENGWLQWQNGRLLIHPVIRKVCHDVLNPNDENCGVYLNDLIGQYDPKDYQKERFRQLAEILSMASVCLEDANGQLALWAGAYWLKVGEYTQALNYELQSLEKIQNNSPKDDDLVSVYNNVGGIYTYLGKYQEALEYQKKVLQIQEKLLPTGHSDFALIYNNVGIVYSHLGNYEAALMYTLKALEVSVDTLPPDHPNLATAYNSVGYIYGEWGKHEKALEYQQIALTIRENALPHDNPDLARSYNNVGWNYRNLGKYKDALNHLQKSLTIREKALPANHPDLAESCGNIAWTYHEMGKFLDAAQYMRRAADIISLSSLPPTHPRRGDTLKLAQQFEKESKMQQDMLTRIQGFSMNSFGFPKKQKPSPKSASRLPKR